MIHGAVSKLSNFIFFNGFGSSNFLKAIWRNLCLKNDPIKIENYCRFPDPAELFFCLFYVPFLFFFLLYFMKSRRDLRLIRKYEMENSQKQCLGNFVECISPRKVEAKFYFLIPVPLPSTSLPLCLFIHVLPYTCIYIGIS